MGLYKKTTKFKLDGFDIFHAMTGFAVAPDW
jgi:hypothetical protein